MNRHRKQRPTKAAGEKSSQPFFVGQDIQLTIDSLSFHGGRGVGRHEGFVVFVADTAPGDRARVRITKVRKALAEADLIEVTSPSPHRRKPPCPVADRCGGCVWQHIDYPTQLLEKQKILAHSLRWLLKDQEQKLEPVVPSPKEFGYRNRIQLHAEGDRIGFFARRTHELVATDHCPIAEPKLSERMAELSQEFKRNPNPHRQRFELALQLNGEIRRDQDQRNPESALFSQVNTLQNESLIGATLQTLSDFADVTEVLDLYCGSGNFSFPIAEKWPHLEITGVELSRSSIELAQQMVQSPNIKFRAMDVADYLKDLGPHSRRAYLLDPPRAGCSPEVLDQLIRLKPSHLIYISCDPMTLQRDLRRLQEAGVLPNLVKVQGFDMFPQTSHIETLVAFSNP